MATTVDSEEGREPKGDDGICVSADVGQTSPSQTLGFPCLAVFKLHAFNQAKSLLGQGGETDLPDDSQFPDKPGCGNRADSPAMSHPASDGKVRVPRPALDMSVAFCLEGPGSKS